MLIPIHLLYQIHVHKYLIHINTSLLKFTFAQLPSTPPSQLIMLGGINIINHILQYLTPQTVALSVLASVVLVHVIPYLLDPNHIRKYPGPFFAKFTDAWFGVICKQGHRSETVHQLHLKYGGLVSGKDKT